MTAGEPAAIGGRVNRLRRFRPPIRLLLAAVMALCLATRVLTPAGFMPSFAAGSLAIVPCPDAEGAPPVAPSPVMHRMDGMPMPDMPMAEPVHDHGGGNDTVHHQPCPYASAASLAGLGLGTIVLTVGLPLAALPPLAQTLPAFRRRATRDRPPAQGPPLPV